MQEDSLNVADLTSLRAPLDIPIPDPPPKDDEVRHLGCKAQTINQVEMMGLQPPKTFLKLLSPPTFFFYLRWKQISRKRKKVREEGVAGEEEMAH